MRDQYATPPNFGIPNPLGPRTHNWKGGPLNEGSLYHGPLYTRPAYGLPRISRPVFGVETESETSLAAVAVQGAVAFGLVYMACELILPKR